LLGGPGEVPATDCVQAVETASTLVTPMLIALVVPTKPIPPAETPPLEKRADDERPAPPPPGERAVPPVRTLEPATATLVETPKPKPRPGVFEGGAGIGRAILYAVSAASLAAGIGFAVAASREGEEAHRTRGGLLQKAGPGACSHSPATFANDCQRILE